MSKLHKIDSKFLLFVLATYIMIFIFSYAFFTISGAVITGNAAMGVVPEKPISLNSAALEKAIMLIFIVFAIVMLILIVSLIYLKQSKNKSLKNNRVYRALNIKSR